MNKNFKILVLQLTLKFFSFLLITNIEIKQSCKEFNYSTISCTFSQLALILRQNYDAKR